MTCTYQTKRSRRKSRVESRFRLSSGTVPETRIALRVCLIRNPDQAMTEDMIYSRHDQTTTFPIPLPSDGTRLEIGKACQKLPRTTATTKVLERSASPR